MGTENRVVSKVKLVGEILTLSEDNLKRVSAAFVSRMVWAFFWRGGMTVAVVIVVPREAVGCYCCGMRMGMGSCCKLRFGSVIILEYPSLLPFQFLNLL